jgi:hypothetical protein
MNVLNIFKLLAFGPALAGYIYITEPAHAKAADPIGDIIAQQMPVENHPSAKTVAVFQKDDGTPCRIREQGTTLSVECYVRGSWQLRRAQVNRVSATTKPAPKRVVVTSTFDVDVQRDAVAAAKVAQEVRFAIAFN